MRRSQWLLMGGWALGLGGVMLACGDAVTGIEQASGGGPDAGKADTSSGSSVIPDEPKEDAGGRDASKPAVTADGGLPAVSDALLDFGLVDCGKTGVAKTFTIQNPSYATVPWSLTLGQGEASMFTVSPSSGELKSGESVVVTVTPKPVPAATATGSNGLGDVLTVTLGTTFASVSLKETARGAILYWSPDKVAFGKTPTGIPAIESGFNIANSGNVAATVTLSQTGSAFALVGTGTVNADVGITGATVSFDPSALEQYQGEVTMAVGSTDVLCGALPLALPLSGEGTDSVISVAPPQVFVGDNGLADCGGQAGTKTVTLKNSGALPIGWGATLGRGSAVFTVSPASSTLAAGGSVDIVITPKAIPSTGVSMTDDAYGDTLKITTTGSVSGPTENNVVIHQSARGALLTRGAVDNKVQFGTFPIETTTTQSYTLTNSGNLDISLIFKKGTPEYGHPGTITISKNSTATVFPTFTPLIVAKDYGDTVTSEQVAPAVPTCANLPGNLSLTGKGGSKSLSANPSTVAFGLVPCDTAGPEKKVRITNNGPATDFTSALRGGVGTSFVVVPDHGPIDANGFIDLTITPKKLPKYTGSVSNNGYGDTLDIESSNGNLAVPFTMTAQGAIITYVGSKTSLSFGTLTNGSSVDQVVAVKNDGNLGAELFFATANNDGSASTVFTATTASTFLAPGFTDNSVAIGFAPPGPGTVTYDGKWIATTSTILCSPLPLSGVGQKFSLTGKGQN